MSKYANTMFWLCIVICLFDCLMSEIAHTSLKNDEISNIFLVSAMCFAVGAVSNSLLVKK